MRASSRITSYGLASLFACGVAFGATGCAADADALDAEEVAVSEDEILAGRTYVVEGEMVERTLPKVDFSDPNVFKDDAWKTPVVRPTGKQAKVVARVLGTDDAGYDVDVSVRVEGEGVGRLRTRLDQNMGGYGPPVWGGTVRSGDKRYWLELQLLWSGNPRVYKLHNFELLRDLPRGANDRTRELVMETRTAFPVPAR